MAVVRGDPAKLWELYSEMQNVRQDMNEGCEDTDRALQVLRDRLLEKKKQVMRKLDDLAGELSLINSKINQAQEEGNPTSELEAMKAAIEGQIRRLEGLLADIRRFVKKAERYRDDLKREKKQCQSDFRKGVRKVNSYMKFLEKILFEEDYAAYEAASGETIRGDSTGRFRKMEFRGTTFYCDDGEMDFNVTDAKGRTNLERMEQGMAPIGSDGLPMNLHHTQQSESGQIMELTQTVHKENHKALHINSNSSIPSGINRNAFNVMKSAYWKRRAAFLKRSTGG